MNLYYFKRKNEGSDSLRVVKISQSLKLKCVVRVSLYCVLAVYDA